MSFCERTYELLQPKTQGEKLTFIAPSTGNEYPSKPEDTLLYERNEGGNSYEISKYKNEIKSAAFNPVNPNRLLEPGCAKCGRKLISFVRVETRVVNACLCGNIWI